MNIKTIVKNMALAFLLLVNIWTLFYVWFLS